MSTEAALINRLKRFGYGQHHGPMAKACSEAAREIERLQKPFRAVDAQDWQYLVSVIPDGGRGRFWKAVLGEMRAALESSAAEP